MADGAPPAEPDGAPLAGAGEAGENPFQIGLGQAGAKRRRKTALAPRKVAGPADCQSIGGTTERVLNEREALFCAHYADPQSSTYGLASESAARAGFSRQGARTAGWRLLRRPSVTARLRKIYSRSIYSPDRVMSNLEADRVAALRAGDIPSAIRVDEILARRLGLLSDRLLLLAEAPTRGAELSEAQRVEARRLASIALDPSRRGPQALPAAHQGTIDVEPGPEALDEENMDLQVRRALGGQGELEDQEAGPEGPDDPDGPEAVV